jgi:Zn-dependent protease with chaperone function
MQQTRRIFWRRGLFFALTSALVLLWTVPTCLAQGDDVEDDAGSAKRTASLNLTFNNRGDAKVSLILDQTPSDWQPIQAALAQSLGCPSQAFGHHSDFRSFRSFASMKPEQREKYQKFIEEAEQKQLQANCSHALSANGWIVDGTLPLQTLTESLCAAGEHMLYVSVHVPKSAFEEQSSEGLEANHEGGDARNTDRFLIYRYALSATTVVSPLHLAYGYRNSDLLRQCAMSAGFLLLPILLMLWMRRAALKDALQDPTAAWFSYFKTLQWCLNGTMLLWMVARTSFREGLQNLIAFRLPAGGWQSAIAGTMVIMVPPWFVYLTCLFLSYEVFLQFRGNQPPGNQWTRRQFMLERLLDVGVQFLPLMFFCCALNFISSSGKWVAALMLAAYVSRVLCVRAKIKISGVAPEALTTGELRDRVFEMAKRATVQIKQVFVLRAGRMQIANAYATSAQTVMFTDYLLQRLTKREVDAIAGHELAHLRHGHPKKLTFTLIGVILFPSIFRGAWEVMTGWIGGLLLTASGGNRDLLMTWHRWSPKLAAWSQLDLVLIVLGLGMFYLLARRFERVADEGAVALAGDSEAMITALLKVSRLNLTPIQWGKVTGSMFTHPTTLKRVEHLAQVGNVRPERLQQLLQQHAQEEQGLRDSVSVGQACGQTPALGDEHYAVPSSARSVESTMAAVTRATNNQWLLIGANVLPPALVAWAVQRLNLHGPASLLAYSMGALLILAAYVLLGLHLSLRGRAEIRQRFAHKFAAEGIQIRGRNATLASFAPGPVLRIYLSGYDWDKGFVWLLQDRMVYLGDKIRFALRPEQVLQIRIGQSAPGWWNSERVYLDWRDAEQGREGTFSLYPSEPSSARKIKAEGKALCAALERWQSHAGKYPVAPQALQFLAAPVLGEVTSHAVKDRLSWQKRLKTLAILLLLSCGACLLVGVADWWYGFGIVMMLRIYERIPYWRYRIPPQTPPWPQPQAAARAQATTGAQ